MEEVTQLKGRTARFSGKGRGLGYPTANIHTNAKLRDGVYLGRATLAEFTDQPSLIFVGIPTTVGDKDWRVEAHLLDIPDRDYYDLPLSLEIGEYMRANRKFASVDELRKQMKADEAYVRSFFKIELEDV